MGRIYCREVSGSDEREICYAIRRQVFVEEQKLFEVDDRDEHDEYAIFYVALFKDKIIGTVRIYCDAEGIWWGGRLAVLKRHRGRAGRLLIQACVERVRIEGATHFRAFVQEENIMFFKTLNWFSIGTLTQICNRPHQLMEAVL